MKFDWIAGLLVVTIAFGFVGALALARSAAEEDARHWRDFSAEHNCKQVTKIEGTVSNSYGFDSNGNMTVGIVSTPPKTGWLCDDGVTYYR